MSNTDYVPKKIAAIDSWEENLSTKLPAYTALFNLPPAMVTDLMNLINEHRTAYAEQVFIEATYRSKVAATDLKKNAAISGNGGIRKVMKMIKSHSNYTTSIGADLGIEVNNSEASDDNRRATIKVKIVPGKVMIKSKMKRVDAFNVYSRVADEEKFIFIGTSVIPWFEDERPKLNGAPEKREYFIRLVIKNKEVGIQSDIATIVVG
ncbi:MAG: hypothetical protein IPH11_03490 [Ignavibacteriales bacterium]|nr:hypothetical protein [Ignavibacteriales bacterium]